MGNLIYADNAATTQLDKDALEAMLPFLNQDFGNPSNKYSFAHFPRKAVEEARLIISNCINASPDEIFFTSGGTESDNWAIKGIALNTQNKGKQIITSSIEHHAILNSCSFLEQMGYKVTYLPVNHQGYISIDNLREVIDTNTSLVSLMLANNEIGTIQNIEELSKIAYDRRVLFHSDAVQAIGHIPIDVNNLGVDLLSASAHKFNGPKGVGFLYIRKGTEIINWSSGGKQENGRRAGTENVAGIFGMAVALKKNIDDMQKNITYVQKLSSVLLDKLSNSSIDFLLNGGKSRLPGNINISLKNRDGEAIMHLLDLKGIIVSTGSACSSGKTDISHVITSIGVPPDYAKGTIRISIGKENSINDVLAIANALISVTSYGSI